MANPLLQPLAPGTSYTPPPPGPQFLAPAPRIPVDLPHAFTGTEAEDFSHWIRRFEVAIDAYNGQGVGLISKAQQLPTRLDGAAFQYWDGLDTTTKNNFQQVKSMLKSLFGRRHMLRAFQNSVTARPRLPLEPLEVFRSELRSLVDEAFPAYNSASKDGEVYRRFLAGLEPSLRAKIIEHGAKDINTALAKAQQIEEAGTCVAGSQAPSFVSRITEDPRPSTPDPELFQLLQDLQVEVKQLRADHNKMSLELESLRRNPHQDHRGRSRNQHSDQNDRSPSPHHWRQDSRRSSTHGRQDFSPGRSREYRRSPSPNPHSSFHRRSPSPHYNRSPSPHTRSNRRSPSPHFNNTSRYTGSQRRSSSPRHGNRKVSFNMSGNRH
jgi:hypothetical protein